MKIIRHCFDDEPINEARLEILRDYKVSLKTKGMFFVLWEHDFDFNPEKRKTLINEINYITKDSTTHIRGCIQELEEQGYLKIEKDEIETYIYHIYSNKTLNK